MIRPLDAPFQLAPKSLNGVRVNFLTDILTFRVSDSIVKITDFLHRLINGGLIRKQGRTKLHILAYQRNDAGKFHILHGLRHNPASALDDTDNGGFVLRPSALPIFLNPANVGFVSFNNVGKLLCRFREQKADLLCHAPRGLIGNAKRTLQLHCRDTISGIGEKEDSVEPVFKRGIRFVEDRASQWMKLIPAILAGIALPIADLVESRFVLLAGGTFGE